jgi:hypothetical protein
MSKWWSVSGQRRALFLSSFADASHVGAERGGVRNAVWAAAL